MTQASLQIDFRPQPRGIAVVTSAPVSSIIVSGRYAAFQDLIDGYASSFAKVFVVSPSGKSSITPKKAARVSWFSGPSWLSPTNGLWWAVVANRKELRNVELIRSFGPGAGIVGRALSKFTKSPHVSSPDDLVNNGWLDKRGWRSKVPGVLNNLGMLSADVLSATLDWELEYLAGTGYMGDLLLGSRGLPTDIYTPVGTTDPDRHPVVLWAGNMVTENSVSMVAEAATSTRKMIPNVEFVVVAENDAADDLRSTASEQDLPLTVAAFRDVEPLVDLVERTWVCVTVPGKRRKMPHGLAMLTLSAGIPLISVGDLGENHGFQNHLNYIRVGRDASDEVAYGLQLLRRWSSFALRIGSAGQRLVEEQYSTRSVALVEGEQLARIASNLDLEVAMSDGARVLEEYSGLLSREGQDGSVESDSTAGAEQASEAEGEDGSPAGMDLVAMAIAAVNGETPPVVESDSAERASTEKDADHGAEMIASLFDSEGSFGAVAPKEAAGSPEEVGDDGDEEGVPQANTAELLSAVSLNVNAVDSAPTEDSQASLGQDAISALFGGGDSEPGVATEPSESASSGGDASGAMDQDAISALFGGDGAVGEVVPEEDAGSPDELEDDGDEDGEPQTNAAEISVDELLSGMSLNVNAVTDLVDSAPTEDSPASLD
jgi:hypothetical protein